MSNYFTLRGKMLIIKTTFCPFWYLGKMVFVFINCMYECKTIITLFSTNNQNLLIWLTKYLAKTFISILLKK